MEYILLDLKNDKEILGSFVALLGVALAYRNGGQHNAMNAQVLSLLIANEKVEVFGAIKDNALYGIQVWDHGIVWTDTTKELRTLRVQYIHGDTDTQETLNFLQWGMAQIKGKYSTQRLIVMGEVNDQLEHILPKCGLDIKTRLYEC